MPQCSNGANLTLNCDRNNDGATALCPNFALPPPATTGGPIASGDGASTVPREPFVRGDARRRTRVVK
jgi:hypothetical protein